MALPPSVQKHEMNLQKCLPKLSVVLSGTGLSAEKLKQTIINSIMQNPMLHNATPQSVMQAAMTAAVLGLEVDGVTGQSYITPFGNKAQFIPGYKGYITLAHNNGYLLQGHVVRENDYFDYSLGLYPKLDHKPADGGPSNRGDIIYSYATATAEGKPPVFKVMHVEQINNIRDKSQGYKAYMGGKIKTTPWASDYEPMAIKTAIRALAPQLPLNVQRAAALEGLHERGEYAHINEMKTVSVEKEKPKDEETSNLLKELNLEMEE